MANNELDQTMPETVEELRKFIIETVKNDVQDNGRLRAVITNADDRDDEGGGL